MLWLIVPCVIMAAAIGFMIRSTMVFNLRERLMNEESDWLRNHRDELNDGRRQWGVFERFKHLPTYDVMVLKFWRSMASFERELGPVEQYYPEKGGK